MKGYLVRANIQFFTLVESDKDPQEDLELTLQWIKKQVEKEPSLKILKTRVESFGPAKAIRVFHCPGCGHKGHEFQETLEYELEGLQETPPVQSCCTDEEPQPEVAQEVARVPRDPDKQCENDCCPRPMGMKCDYKYANQCRWGFCASNSGPCQCECHKILTQGDKIEA